MSNSTTIAIPSLVKIKSGAIGRLGVYCRRSAFQKVALLASSDLPSQLQQKALDSLTENDVTVASCEACTDAAFEEAQRLFISLPPGIAAVIGLGGGRALDVAKYVAFLARKPYIAVPTSLSNDGFCSPGVSLTVAGGRRSLPAAMPFGVVVDIDTCLAAPEALWHSGVGDLASKLTAVRDWKLAFHAVGEPVNDFAALLSDATVHQFISRPMRDLEGVRLLATALMLNGVAMEVCGSSRPASGSEHLISHALDRISARPRLHGLQVGVAAYIVSILQQGPSSVIGGLFTACGFWNAIRSDPFEGAEWLQAVKLAPAIKSDFYTVLTARDFSAEVAQIITTDNCLQGCFR